PGIRALSLHDALPILSGCCGRKRRSAAAPSSSDWPRRSPLLAIISLISASEVSPKFLLLKSCCSLTRVRSPSVLIFIFLRQLRLDRKSTRLNSSHLVI